jgi:hypothetical protein
MAIIEKLVKWIMFSVAVALLPLVFRFLQIVTRGQLPSIQDITSQGELLLISGAMAAAALGEIIMSNISHSILKIISGGFCVIMLLISSFYYADIASYSFNGLALNKGIASEISIITYIFTLISSGSCIAVAEVE